MIFQFACCIYSNLLLYLRQIYGLPGTQRRDKIGADDDIIESKRSIQCPFQYTFLAKRIRNDLGIRPVLVCSVAFRLRIHSLFAIQQHSPVKLLDESTCQQKRISDSQPKYCYKIKRYFISYDVEADEQYRM